MKMFFMSLSFSLNHSPFVKILESFHMFKTVTIIQLFTEVEGALIILAREGQNIAMYSSQGG